MENEVQPNIPPVQPVPHAPPVAPSPTNLSKIVLSAVFGLVVVAGLVYFGIQIGKNQTASRQPITVQPTAIPTTARINAPLDELVVKTKNESTITPIVTSPYVNSQSINLPIVIYNLSTEDYATHYKNITDKIVMPYLDYYLKGGGNEEKDIKILVINRTANQGYEFAFDSFTSTGKPGESGLINNNPKTGELNYWFPHCMGNCILSKSYITKYPEVSKLAAPLPSE